MALMRFKLRPQMSGGAFIQTAEGLVEKQNPWFRGNCPRQGRSLLLSPAHFTGQTVRQMENTEPFQERHGFPVLGLASRFQAGHSQKKVLSNGQVRKKQQILKKISHPALVGRQTVDTPAVESNDPLIGQQAGDHLQERAFPGSRWPQHHKQLPPGNGQFDFLKDTGADPFKLDLRHVPILAAGWSAQRGNPIHRITRRTRNPVMISSQAHTRAMPSSPLEMFR
jgi:hypothetical protein